MSSKEKAASLEGQFLDPITQKWLISKKIGTGACGSVYNLIRNRTSSKTSSSSSSATEFAVKVAKLPPPSTNMKRKKTLLEKNADLLNHEHVLYRNILNNLRGTMVPELPLPGSPKGLNAFGEVAGYRYLVMEKMDAPLSSIVPIMAETDGIYIGPIAERFVRLLESLHGTCLLFVDVKPENFMLGSCSVSSGNTSHRKGIFTESHVRQLADRIRMIDFGLVESFKDAVKNKHRMDMFPNGQVVGTPIYASLNVLSGHTVSRRDDLESCFYIWVELVLQIVAYKNKADSSRNAQSRQDVPMDLLPWSKAKSDEEIKRLKEDAMSDEGIVWKLLANDGNDGFSLQMKEIYKWIRSLDFKEKPNYDELVSLVGRLKVKVHVGNRKTKSNRQGGTSKSLKRESTTPTNNTKRDTKRIHKTTNSTSSPLYDEDVKPISIVASTRASRAAARAAAKESLPSTTTRHIDQEESDVEMISVIESSNKSDDESVIVVDRGDNHDSNTDAMDWELVTNENKAFLSNVHNTKSKSTNKPHLYLECINGPQKGESFTLTDTLVLGSGPSTRKKEARAVINDTSVSSNHARLVLNQTGSKKNCILMAKVFDLNSDSGTIINGKTLPKGSSRQAFVNDQIKLGNSTFLISKSAGSV